MTDLSKKMEDKINAFLPQWLEDDEVIIAQFNANRIKPVTNALVLTSRRLITMKGVYGNVEPVYEIAADDILDFAAEKGFGKVVKLFVAKKNGETEYICTMARENIVTAINQLPGMSGKPQPVREKMDTAHRQLAEQKREARQEEKAARRVVKQEEKAAKAAAIKARGRELGSVLVDYMGGYGPEYKRTHLGDWLRCYENEIQFKKRQIRIPADEITSFEITGKEQTNSRLSVTRMATLGVFSLAAPKRSTKKEASIFIGLKDGRQLMFQTDRMTESDVHRKLANAISHYSSLRIRNENQQLSQSVQSLDVAGEIARFAELRDKGILTNDEFEMKKKQLLDL